MYILYVYFVIPLHFSLNIQSFFQYKAGTGFPIQGSPTGWLEGQFSLSFF